MRLSQLFTKTNKTAPAEEVAKNAQLLIRAGYVYKVMAGVYVYTPLGLRVLENIKQIIREEMNAIGGQELIMSSLQKKETWEITGRWDDEVVDVWFKSKLKDETEVGFGWSHEEAIIEMIKQYLKSYKDLPINVYQFQTKMRNELRAKSGIMRGREFVMKDMYSCSIDAAQHEAFYQATIDAYNRIFDRLGIGKDTYVTFASGGAFTQFSHEFQTVCEAGEDVIYRIPSSGESFNEEIAPTQAPALKSDDKTQLPMKEVKGAGVIGVDQLAAFLKIPVEKTTKTMLYKTNEGTIIAAVVRGGYKINEDKLRAILQADSVTLLDEEAVRQVTGASTGYAGLINLPPEVKVIVDESCAHRINFEMGLNRTDYHAVNVNWGRDLPLPAQFYDIKTAQKGDIHPETGEVYDVLKTAEVGNIFNFGTQKSEDTDFTFTNAEGEEQFVHLGSYGIGVTRVMGVVVEKFADERGLVWPESIAPFKIIITRLGQDDAVIEAANKLYKILKDKKIAVMYDDRDMRAGEKFADADLYGIPHRIVISSKLVQTGQFEYKQRTVDTPELLTEAELLAKITPQAV